MPGIQKLGKYEIVRELGKGAMGVVYEGFDPFIERKVAVKTIQKSAVDPSEAAESFQRFRREAQAAGRLTHSRIVSIYEYGEDEDVAFIAMEFVRGRELKDYFDKDERFPIEDAALIMLQILDALDYSHGRGVVHRDIKPANILITEDGQVKVADFGIAKIDSSHFTHAGTVLGTPAYMSPEQFSGELVDHRTDLYSAGVILYQFLTGEKPFTGSVFSIMHKVQNMEPQAPSVLNPAIPDVFDKLMSKALAKRAGDRFQSAAEFIAALKVAMGAFRTTATGPVDPEATLMALNEVKDEAKADEDPIASDIAHWKLISTSLDGGDFARYLEKYPDGEFAELARRRIIALDPAPKTGDALQRKAESSGRHRIKAPEKPQSDATGRRRILENGLRKKAAQVAKATIDAEALRKAWQLKVAEVRSEGARAKAEEEAKRKVAAAERVRRAQDMAGVMAERGQKLAAILTERQAEISAEKEFQAEKKRRLQAEAQRKLQAEESARREIEFAKARELANLPSAVRPKPSTDTT